MAEGILRSLDSGLEVFSAGTHPSGEVHPKAIKAMAEIGHDISRHYPKKTDEFLTQEFDYVITVCGGAKESCPVFSGKVANRRHIGFDDPAEAVGSEDEIMAVFRRVRDEIIERFSAFYKEEIASR